ncbi:TIGR03089 family protein [Corynebacterium bovis]|uniref:TIGR03089 family protein n=1 Tax=Corynebacterium bovis TaxID=36808 RepID=UPI0036C4462D
MKPRAGHRPRRDLRALWLVGPAMLVLAVVIGYPVVRAVGLSFEANKHLDPETGMFVTGGFAGVEHYLYWLTQRCMSPSGEATQCAPGQLATDFWPAVAITLFVTLGCWRIGATVTDGSGAGAGEHVGVVVTDDLPGIGGDLEDADEILLLSSDPFGRGVAESGGEVPFGVTDMAPELRVQPDAFLGAEATGGVLYRGLSPAGGRVEVTEEHLRREAGAVVAQLGDAPRVVVPGWDDAATMTRRLLPLVVGGSVVVVDDAAAELDAVAETERGRVADLE